MDYDQALTWYQKAAVKNHAAAQYSIGALYAAGLGVQQDHETAIQYYRASGELGYAPAQFALAQLYEAGIVVPKNLAEAKAWYAKAAAQGDQRAREQMTRIDRDGPESGAPSGAAERRKQQDR
jgi:hypothetical protein